MNSFSLAIAGDSTGAMLREHYITVERTGSKSGRAGRSQRLTFVDRVDSSYTLLYVVYGGEHPNGDMASTVTF